MIKNGVTMGFLWGVDKKGISTQSVHDFYDE